MPRCAFLRIRTAGSTHTCWICTAAGVHADASALNRIVPFSAHSHERPSSIGVRESVAAGAGGYEVCADVAERRQPAVVCFQRREAAQPAPRYVLEEYPLDRLFGAEREDLVETRDGLHATNLRG